MNGGDKSFAARRYVHGIIQIQVREQVLPIEVGLAKPEIQQNVNHSVADNKTEKTRVIVTLPF
jgi:hypothetical protein